LAKATLIGGGIENVKESDIEAIATSHPELVKAARQMLAAPPASPAADNPIKMDLYKLVFPYTVWYDLLNGGL
jgi:hypothetical protein